MPLAAAITVIFKFASYTNRWIMSEAKKDGVEDSIAKYDGKALL